MTKKTLVSSLSLAAVALALATVPVTSAFATETTTSPVETSAKQPVYVYYKNGLKVTVTSVKVIEHDNF